LISTVIRIAVVIGHDEQLAELAGMLQSPALYINMYTAKMVRYITLGKFENCQRKSRGYYDILSVLINLMTNCVVLHYVCLFTLAEISNQFCLAVMT